jgi:hypothetical protein
MQDGSINSTVAVGKVGPLMLCKGKDHATPLLVFDVMWPIVIICLHLSVSEVYCLG